MTQRPLNWQEFGSARIAFVDTLADIPTDLRLVIVGSKDRFRRLGNDLQREIPGIELAGHVKPLRRKWRSQIPFLASRFTSDKPSKVLLTDSVHWTVRIPAFIESGFRNFIILDPKERHGSFRHSIVCHEKKFIFVPIYKSLYTSICNFIGRSFSEFHGARAKTRRLGSVVDLGSAEFEDYFKFSVVRNPWERVLSCYNDKFTRPVDHGKTRNWRQPLGVLLQDRQFGFEDFVSFISRIPNSHSDRHWVSQSTCLFTPSDQQLVNYIGRFENIQEDIKEISKLAGVNFVLKHLNPSEKTQQTSEMIDSRIDRLIRDRYSEDIQQFGYDSPALGRQAI